MTVLCILGLVPIMWSSGTGSDVMQMNPSLGRNFEAFDPLEWLGTTATIIDG